MKNKANGPSDCLVTEMLQTFPIESVCEITHRFEEMERRAPQTWNVLRLVFLKMPDARQEKNLRGLRAVALMCVLSKWYTLVLVGLLHEETEPIEWEGLHVGAGRGVKRYC